MMNSYIENPTKNHSRKIAAINLLFACSIKNFSNMSIIYLNIGGVTEMLISHSDLANYLQIIFIREFEDITFSKSSNLVKIYSLKFLLYFRQQIPLNWLGNTINLLLNLCDFKNEVLLNASILTLEKILYMKDSNQQKNVCAEVLKDKEIFNKLMQKLFDILNSKLNVLTIKCLLRAFILCPIEYVVPNLSSIVTLFNYLMKEVIKNPSEDQFNYYFFETIALIMRKLANNNALDALETFEKGLHELMNFIISNTNSSITSKINDLFSYVFQIIALQIFLNPNISSTDGVI